MPENNNFCGICGIVRRDGVIQPLCFPTVNGIHTWITNEPDLPSDLDMKTLLSSVGKKPSEYIRELAHQVAERSQEIQCGVAESAEAAHCILAAIVQYLDELHAKGLLPDA